LYGAVEHWLSGALVRWCRWCDVMCGRVHQRRTTFCL